MRVFKNKSIMFICIVTTLILLFLTGYSAWVIINVKDNDTTPTYNYRDIIISAYRDNQSKVYNEDPLGPDAYIDGEIDTDNLIDVDQYEFYHRVQGSTDWDEGLPNNSGTYDIKIKNKADSNPDNPIIITFTIDKAQPTLTANDINIFVNNDYEVQYSYDGDSEDVTIEYFDGENKIDKPTAVGTYKAIITISEGNNYLSVSKEINIKINNTLIIGPEHIQEIGTVEYEGSQIKPEPVIIVDGVTLVKGKDYSVEYGENLNVGPGSIIVTGMGNYGGKDIVKNFTITWKYLTPQDLAINYNSLYRTFDLIKNNQILTNTTNESGQIISGLVLKDSSENIFGGESLISILNMNDGNYGYGQFDDSLGMLTTTTNVVGSTYYVSIDITNENYKLTQPYFILKYQTAMIGSSYYTIEDALKNTTSGTIILAGENGGANYVITSFSLLDSTLSGYNSDDYYTLKCKLRVPFDSANLDFHGAGGLTKVNGSTNGCTEQVEVASLDIVYSVLMIPNDTITLKIAEGGILNIGGLISGNGIVTNRGVVMNHGTINALKGSAVYSYGYLKGTGLLEVQDSTITDVFRMWDWRGGAYSAGMNSAKIFPLNGYSTHNISCDTKLYAGSTYKSFWTIMFDNALFKGFQRGDLNGNIEIIGSSGMFNLTSGYIMKSTLNSEKNSSSDALDIITGSNQLRGQKDVIKIYGTCVDHSVSVSIKAGTFFTFDMKSTVEMPLPVGFMDVEIGIDGSNVGHLTLQASSYKFYPGSSIKIHNGAKLTLSNGASLTMFNINDAITDQANISTPFITASGGLVIDRKDAYMQIDGTFEIKSGTHFGGKILTSGSTGKIILSGNNLVTNKYVTSVEDGLVTDTVNSSTFNIQMLLYLYDQLNRAPSTILSNPSTGATYYAVDDSWAVADAVISFDINGGTSSNIPAQTKTVNSDSSRGFVLTESYLSQFVPTRTGYTFGGWYLDQACTAGMEARNVTVYSNITLYAKWTINQYTITFITNGGTSIESISQNYGTTITKPNDPTRLGYTFAGWDKEIPSTMPAENMTITANWTINSYTITFNTNGGTIISAIKQNYGTTITKPNDPTRIGYTFAGWDKEIPSTMPAENITITANWTINSYTITFDSNGGSTVNSITQNYGTSIELPIPTRDEYTFDGWMYNGEPYTGSTMPASNITLVAKWLSNSATTYQVIFQYEDGTIITSTKLASGEIIVPPTVSKTGYTFDGWYLDDAKVTDFTMGENDTILVAKFVINQYTITFNTNGGTLIESITQDYGTPITQPSNPTKVGYTFDKWDQEIPLTMPAENITITAQWDVNSYTISFNTNGGTSIGSITQEYGTQITKPNDPTKVGHTFAGWDQEIPLTMPAENITITATWTINSYTISFDSNGGSTVNSITQEYGTAITLPTPTMTGHTFVGWYNNDNPYNTTEMPANNVSLVARWQINQYTITFDTLGGTNIQSITQDYGTSIIKPANPTKQGYDFTGWSREIPSTMPAENIIITANYVGKTFTINYSYNNSIVHTQSYTFGSNDALYEHGSNKWYDRWIARWYLDSAFTGSYLSSVSEITTYPDSGSITLYGKKDTCLAEGTLITMADGTKKKVEDILTGDLLIVFNHETGKYETAEVLFNDAELINNYTVVNLEFSNGSKVRVIAEHGFFDLDLMKYVYIDEYNYMDYLGHRFVASTYVDGEVVQSVVTLDNAFITEEYIRVYSPVTKYHMNYITEDILSMPGGIEGLFNIFEYDDNLQYNEEQMQKDIETYGLFTYEDFKDLVSYEVYCSFPAAYFKVALGKGILTWEDLEYYIARYAPLV